MTDNTLVKYRFSIVLWMGFIFWMSTGEFSAANTSKIIEPLLRFFMPTLSNETLQLLHGIIRKCAHVTEYFILGLLVYHSFRNESDNRKIMSRAVVSMLVIVGFALTDEFHQSFVISRTASLVDVSIDAFGGFLSQSACLLWHRRRRASDAV